MQWEGSYVESCVTGGIHRGKDDCTKAVGVILCYMRDNNAHMIISDACEPSLYFPVCCRLKPN